MLFEFSLSNKSYPKVTTLSSEDIKLRFNRSINWGFLDPPMLDVLNRNGLQTWEIIDVLQQYKFADNSQIVPLMESIYGVIAGYLDSNSIKDRILPSDSSLEVLVLSNEGTPPTVYVSIRNPISSAHLQLYLPYKQFSVVYLSDANFKQCKYNTVYSWDYYILFSRFMWYCISVKASDFHLDVSHKGNVVTYPVSVRVGEERISCPLFELDSDMNKLLVTETIRNRSGNAQAISDLNQGFGVVTSISDVFGNGQLQVRFCAEKVLEGYALVCRLQTTKTVTLTLDDLGFDPRIVRLLKESTNKPSGLTIITGKIRTGKNTTMCAVACSIVKRADKPHVLSLDDPIEIVGEYSQVDYHGSIEKLMACISNAKKMDLDYVLLNEIPNAKVAFGVRDLVNSSVHTMTTWHQNRIWHLPHKLFEYFGESFRDLISQVNIICNQRMYQGQCENCLAEIHKSKFSADDERIVQFLNKYSLESCMVSQGCNLCDGTGKRTGRIVVIPEVLVFTHELVFELFSAERVYDMERILFKAMLNSPYSLEAQLCLALKDGRLPPKDILTII